MGKVAKGSPKGGQSRGLLRDVLTGIGPVLGQATAYHEGHTAGLKTAATLLLTHAEDCERNLGGEGVGGVGRTVFGISASVALRIVAIELAQRAGDKDLEKLAKKVGTGK